MSNKTLLTISITATYEGDEYVPEEESLVQEVIALEVPMIEAKYVVFPKVIEGVTTQVVETHRAKVRSYLYKKEKEAIKPSFEFENE